MEARRRAKIYLLLLFTLMFAASFSGVDRLTDLTSGFALQQAKSSSSLPTECIMPRVVDEAVPPTFCASYPGSGAKLTWRLVRGITGIMTGDDLDLDGGVARGHAVTVKTHHPHPIASDIALFEKVAALVPRAIVLVRNPINALPSYFNFMYERQNGLRNHSTRAPQESWMKWRDTELVSQVNAWVHHLEWWLEHYQDDRIIISFERLVQDPQELKRVYRYLAKVDHEVLRSSMKPQERNLSCIWDAIVNNKVVPGEKATIQSHREGGPSEYSYTPEQLDYIIQALKQVYDLHRERDTDVAQLVAGYLHHAVEVKKFAMK